MTRYNGKVLLIVWHNGQAALSRSGTNYSKVDLHMTTQQKKAFNRTLFFVGHNGHNGHNIPYKA